MSLRLVVPLCLGLLGTATLSLVSRPVVAADACETHTSNADLTEQLDRGEASFVALDDQGFDAALHKVNLTLRCLSEPIAPAVATRLHWMNGLQLYLQEEPQRAAFALAAARTGQDGYQLSASVLPKGHELWSLYEGQDPTPEVRALPPPKAGVLLFDGAAGSGRPTDRATVVQLQLPDASISLSRYLLPGQGLPDYGAQVVSPDWMAGGVGAGTGAAVRQQRVRRRPLNPWLTVATGLSAAGATTALLLAQDAKARFEQRDPTYTFEDLQTMQNQANRRGAAGIALGAGAAGLGVSAVFVGVWK